LWLQRELVLVLVQQLLAQVRGQQLVLVLVQALVQP
jgi:hypothetical protein